ncbi:cap binding protein, putative [Ixodes scapularis]|uniref:Nuclear cap-binding protein subunit 1 n=1 Tax=Ixodes scapularis TaxID=6945 RepID=B7Q634_IXOSC|nr:cap binding protein, putative [Ixodes scapularis]|eukprot:XP_002411881.1 cap binding protein, putative [Ixodes scapularis]
MSRRRPYEDDDDDGKRRRRVSSEPKEIEDRLESLIMRVGEKSTSSLESNLEGLAGVLDADLPSYKGNILSILAECAIKMPEKTTIYTTLIGLLNTRNYNFGGEFVELLVKSYRECLKECKFEDARIIVRFFSDLVNCHVISVGSLVTLFESMLEVTLEEGTPQVRSDWYVYAVLTALPWVGRELYEKKDQELDRLLRHIDDYISKRQKKHVPALRVWQAEVPHAQEEGLDCLWAQVSKLRGDKWVERQLVRPYLAFDGVLCEALQHNLPPLPAPPHRPEDTYPFPRVVFRLFDYTDCPDGPVLPGAHLVERFLAEEQLCHILDRHHTDRKLCAAQLLSFPGKVKLPLEYMIVEVIFGELLRLPTSKNLEICYGSLLLELCKLQPSTMPQVLAQAVELLYERLDTMNTDCIDRLSCKMLFVHCSGIRLCGNQQPNCFHDCVKCTPCEVKHKQRRVLSYHQRILDFVPESFAPFVPAKPAPDYRYAKEGAESIPGAATAARLSTSIREKCTPEEALEVLADLPNPLQEDDVEPAHNPLKIQVFVETLLHIASKSFSHSFAGIAKFHYVFKSLASTEEAQICVLRSTFNMMIGLVDKFLKTQIVECSAVANWIFSKDLAAEFTRSYVWEILHLTIRKMIKHEPPTDLMVERMEEKLEATQSDLKNLFLIIFQSEDKEPPTDLMVERMEEKLEATQSDLKNLFLIIFQRFIMSLTEHIAHCEAEGTNFQTHWFRWTLGRLQEVFFQHHEHVFKYVTTLESLVFTNDIDPHVLEVFQQFAALRA